MTTCVAQKSLTQLPPIICHQTFHHSTTNDERMSNVSSRKRLMSEQNDRYTSSMKKSDDECEINKRTKTGILAGESKDNNQHRQMQCSTLYFFESTRCCRSAPERRKSLIHTSFTCIKDVTSTETAIHFLPTLKTPSKEKNMLAYQQTPVIVNNTENDKVNNSIFLTCPEVAAYMTAINNQKVLIVDCGSPLRHTERRIQDSLLLNVNDKISRKRLSTRGLKNFLDSKQMNRVESNDTIILYDDIIRPAPLETIQIAPPMKCVFDEIKRYDTNKTIYILQSPFDEFYKHHPSLCYISTSTDDDISMEEPMTAETLDIDLCEISEILPGLYLGNANDAENLNILKKHQIQTIINISTSIPCYHETDKNIDYYRLPCHDSPNQNILQYFETTFEYIHQKLSANKNTLVHCQGGVSRSPSFIIGYLMKFHSKTFNEAYNLVRNRRSIVNPNLNFLGQLTQYQNMLTSA